MRYRRLDNDGDMTFGSQQKDFLRDAPTAVVQAVITRLKLWVDEWFLDTSEGTPYVQAALGKYTSQTIAPAIRERILTTEGVTEITAFEVIFNPDTRVAKVEATIETIYGPAVLTEVI